MAYITPEDKFRHQRQQAKQRQIAWELSFDEWWAVWQESGKWSMRGPGVGQYVMARHGDKGPYSTGNVFICTSTDNRKQAHQNGCCDSLQALGTGRGWNYREGQRKPYEVVVCGRYVGSFLTEEEAQQGYRAAVAAKRAELAQPA